jgi:hypothetical protein
VNSSGAWEPFGLFRLVAALCVVGLPRPALADAPRASLVVTRAPGAEDCPDTAAVSARIRPLMRSEIIEPTVEASPDTWIQVELVRELAVYRAVISARGRRKGTRTIEDVGESCVSIADALAITLVMMLDPEPASPAMPPLPPPEPESPRPSPIVPTSPPAEREAVLRLGAEASGGASTGILHHAAPLVEVGTRVGVGRRFTLGAGGGLVFPDRAPIGGRSVKLDLSYAYLRGSVWLFESGATELALVAGPLLGSLAGEGSGYDVPSKRHLLWGAATAGAELFASLAPPFAWSARLLAVVPLVNEGFSVERAGETVRAFRTPALGGLLTVGVSAALIREEN